MTCEWLNNNAVIFLLQSSDTASTITLRFHKLSSCLYHHVSVQPDDIFVKLFVSVYL